MILTRKENWPALLAEFVSSHRAMPFAWGVNDCCLFCADWIELSTGIDLANTWRGQYSDALGARRLSKTNGFEGDGSDLFGVLHWPGSVGLPYMDPRLMGRGDVAAIAYDDKEMTLLGVCIGARITAPGKDGILFLPRTAAKAAWRI